MEAKNISVDSKKSDRSLEEVRAFWEETPCGEHFVDGTPLEEGSPEFFEAVTRERYRWEYHLQPFIRDFVNATNKGKILEVGCGMGIDLSQIAKGGCTTMGVDLTEKGIGLARKNFDRLGLKGEFRVENAEELSFGENQFDGVYSMGVLHHTPNTSRAIEEVRRVLKPGGWAYIMLYSRVSLNHFVHQVLQAPYEKTFKSKFKDAPVTRAYTKRELQALFGGFGLARFSKRYLFGAGYKPVSYLVPNFANDLLGRLMGWHWMIRAQK